MLTLDTVKHNHQFAWVPVQPQPIHFPDPVVPVSDLDLAIIGALGAQRTHVKPGDRPRPSVLPTGPSASIFVGSRTPASSASALRFTLP